MLTFKNEETKEMSDVPSAFSDEFKHVFAGCVGTCKILSTTNTCLGWGGGTQKKHQIEISSWDHLLRNYGQFIKTI